LRQVLGDFRSFTVEAFLEIYEEKRPVFVLAAK
jgi:hypothetical protein